MALSVILLFSFYLHSYKADQKKDLFKRISLLISVPCSWILKLMKSFEIANKNDQT